jgi:hypothetical protein
MPTEATLKVPSEKLDGLTDEEKSHVMTLAYECGDMNIVDTYIGWLKAGNVAFYNTGSTIADALEKIFADLQSIRFNDNLEPVKPMECFHFKYSMVSYFVAVRFRIIG